LGFQPFKNGRPPVEDLAPGFHESRPAPGIRPAPKGFLANPKFLSEIGAANPALQEGTIGPPRLRDPNAGFKLRHLCSPACRPLWANVVKQQKHSGRGGRVAVTGSEIVGAATPCFIEFSEIHAAAQQDLQALQTRVPSAQRTAGAPKLPDLPQLHDIRRVPATVRGGNGWQ